MKERILIGDDEKSIANNIAYAFRREGYSVEVAYDGAEALKKIQYFQPNLVILDVMMPQLDGFEVCKQIQDKSLGIILLTAKSDIVDKILGLELGADDYITKPFDIRELLARSKSILRRLSKNTLPTKEQVLQIEALQLCCDQRQAFLGDKLLDLTPKEFELLYFLLSHPNRVHNREELLEKVWEFAYVGGTRTVDLHIQRLRKKLGEPYANLIQTVHRVGYKGLNRL